MKLKYIFGPVLSRRLGRSLGIDLIPYKTCTLDCVYCECGKTNNHTLERKEYVPTEEVIEELDHYLMNSPELDYITFSGSGEPTLHSGIGKIINFLKNKYPQYRVALLTNSTLFINDDLVKEVKRVDLIVPSLDAVSRDAFEKIDRPVKGIDPGDIVDGLEKLRQNYSGKIWIEIFIVPGINDNEKEIQLLKQAIERIKPDKVQLNRLDRLGTEEWVEPASDKLLSKVASLLGNNIEIVI